MKTTLLPILFCFNALIVHAQDYYSVKFPDDITLYGCGLSAPYIPPMVDQYAGCNFNVSVAYNDAIFNINGNGTCKKVLRTWKLVYWCDYDPNWPGPTVIANPPTSDTGPTVLGNAANHGYLEYTQVIKLLDNESPITVDCPTAPLDFCDLLYDSSLFYSFVSQCEGPVQLSAKAYDACSQAQMSVSYLLFLDLDNNGSMETQIGSSDPGAWPIIKTAINDTLVASVDFPVGFGLPYGTHKIKWIFHDDCGNEGICEYSFVVRDCLNPVVFCLNGISINIMQTGMITDWDVDFINFIWDNCTQPSQLDYAIRKFGTGTGFPQGSHSVTYDCSELGQNWVEIWVQDESGNADYCITEVLIQDNMGNCGPQNISGTVMNLSAKPAGGLPLNMTQTGLLASQSWTGTTDVEGAFLFQNIHGMGAAFSTPAVTQEPGTTIKDVLLSAQHQFGMQALENPFKIIAADVDGNQVLEEADLESMVQQIIAPQNQQENLLIPANYPFANAQNPLAEVSNSLSMIQTANQINQPTDWYVLRRGDVDGSAFGLASEEKMGQDFVLLTPDQQFEPGEEVTVTLQAQDLDGTAGFQFSLQFDQNALVFQGNTPQLIPSSWISVQDGIITGCWNYLTGGLAGKNAHFDVMELHFTALAAGTLSESLQLATSPAAPIGYSPTFKKRAVSLQFSPPQKHFAAKKSTCTVSPNPTSGAVQLIFDNPLAGAVRITETDAFGNICKTTVLDGIKGQQIADIQLNTAKTGWHYLRVETGKTVYIVRVMVEPSAGK